MRIVHIEAFFDELGMILVLGKQNRLTQQITTCDGLPTRHQMLEHFIDSIGVEQPLVDGRCFHPVGDVSVLVPFLRVPLVFLFLAQVMVLDSVTLELDWNGDGLGRN